MIRTTLTLGPGWAERMETWAERALATEGLSLSVQARADLVRVLGHLGTRPVSWVALQGIIEWTVLEAALAAGVNRSGTSALQVA